VVSIEKAAAAEPFDAAISCESINFFRPG
jgi:hypothetical protein